MDQIKIGNLIKKLRIKQEMTQEQLAEKLGVSNKSVSRWENGICMPDFSLFEPICEVFNITLIELLTGTLNTEDISKEILEEETKKIFLEACYNSKMLEKRFIILSTLNMIISIILILIAFYWPRNDSIIIVLSIIAFINIILSNGLNGALLVTSKLLIKNKKK